MPVPVPAFLSIAAFFLAIVFHGAKFAPDLWFNWQGLALIGLFFLAWYPVREWWPRRQPPA